MYQISVEYFIGIAERNSSAQADCLQEPQWSSCTPKLQKRAFRQLAAYAAQYIKLWIIKPLVIVPLSELGSGRKSSA